MPTAPTTTIGALPWKVYGPDLNGVYGGLQGTGGLEATVLNSGGTATGIINDYFGNGVATISGGSVTWNATKVGGYGPLPDSTATPLTDATQLAQSMVWRGHRIDPTGFYWLGARYYEPTSGRFLSPDPKGQAASMSLYDFCNGDPVNGFDPDGRCMEAAQGAVQYADTSGPNAGGGVTQGAPSQDPNNAASTGSPNGPTSPLLNSVNEIQGLHGPSNFDVGNPLMSNMTPDQAAQVNALINQLSNTTNPVTGQLTQAALLVRALQSSGAASLITVEGEFNGQPMSHGSTLPVNADGTLDGAEANAINGVATPAKITIEAPGGSDALGTLAHEIGNATSIVTGQGNFNGDIENESLRLGNEVKQATGNGGLVSDTMNGTAVPQWNRYIPWVTKAPQHR
jgi:RHS repeat-associated protein